MKTIYFFQVLLVTAQLIIFGNYRFNHTKYYNDNLIAFEHLFLKGWDSVREIHAYPPAAGKPTPSVSGLSD
jgi:mucolipin 3